MSEIVEPRTLSGFMELLPKDQVIFEKIKSEMEKVYRKYGFYPLDTPVLEDSRILLAKAGGETEKQIYRFNKGDSDLTMRYFRTVFSLTLTSSERIIIVLQLWQNSRIFCCLSLQEPDPQTACTVCLSFAFQKGCFIWQLLLRNP